MAAKIESPPLLPMSPPYGPSGSPITKIIEGQSTSSPEDLIAPEIEQMEREFFEKDDAISFLGSDEFGALLGGTTTDLQSAETLDLIRPSSSIIERDRLDCLKLTPPLVITRRSVTPARRSLHSYLSSDVDQLVPEPRSDIPTTDTEAAEKHMDDVLEHIAAPAAEAAMHRVENEGLVQIDTTARVQVPSLEDVILRLPWEEMAVADNGHSRLEKQRRILKQSKEELLTNERRWRGVSSLERELHWTPVPSSLGRVDVNEQFDNGAASQCMDGLMYEDAPDPESLLGHINSLCILEPQEDDEDEVDWGFVVDTSIQCGDQRPSMKETLLGKPALLEPETHSDKLDAEPVLEKQQKALPSAVEHTASPVMNMRTLLRKRKLELERSQIEGRVQKRTDRRRMEPARPSNILLGNRLENFLRVQVQSEFLFNKEEVRPAAEGYQEDAGAAETVTDMDAAGNRVDAQLTCPSLPVPIFDEVAAADTQIVIGSHVMSQRSLTREIQKRLPDIHLVERETNYSPKDWTKNQLGADSQPEADLTVSPSIGMMLITLQKLKQKPLPGQTSYRSVRDRIAVIAPRYEELIVLVSEGKPGARDHGNVFQPLDDRDCEALTDLMADTALLETRVQVLYVAGGDEELAGWICGHIVHRRGVSGGARLLTEETMWERVLRVAGMNSFAAQTVLAGLKHPANEMSHGGCARPARTTLDQPGLARFFAMSAPERLGRCGSMLHSEGMLRRMHSAIEGVWFAKET